MSNGAGVLDRIGRESLRALFDASPYAMVLVDAEGRIAVVNSFADRLFGYSRNELDGQPVEILLPEDERGHHVDRRNEFLHSPQPRQMGSRLELFGRRKDGTEFPVDIMSSPLPPECGAVVGVSIRDITDRKQLEQQLERKNEELQEQYRRVQEANRQRSEFLADMGHELRTPLNAIIGFSELMVEGLVGPMAVAHKEYVGEILVSANRLLQLINDLVELAKVEADEWSCRVT
jgi:protein-histidine pros-kinase